MYNEYEEIYEELCERVKNEELTLEEAEVVNDYAYDLYVVDERSNFDRFIDGRADEKEKLLKRGREIMRKKQNAKNEKIKTMLHNREMALLSKGLNKDVFPGNEGKIHRDFRSNDLRETRKYLKKYFHDPYSNSIPELKKDLEKYHEKYRSEKKKIKEALGDRGQRPEERYKAGRYLKMQNAINGK